MFCLNDTMRYYLCLGRTDMRKGISSLCGVVHERMKSDVRNGEGRFKLPEYDENTQSYQMEWRDLVVMVEGIQESPDQRLRRLRAQRREYMV